MTEDREKLVAVLTAHATNCDLEGTPKVGAWFRKAAATLKADGALIEAQAAEIAGLAKALEVFARCPAHGKNGGRFVIAHAVYKDMAGGSLAPREAYWHADDFERARQALARIRNSRDGDTP